MTVEEQMEEDTGSRLLWFAAGAAIGSTLAILFAPKTGTETRHLISEKARVGADAVADTSRDMFFERGKAIVEKATSALEEQVKEATQA
jgi:gas vesicle protein